MRKLTTLLTLLLLMSSIAPQAKNSTSTVNDGTSNASLEDNKVTSLDDLTTGWYRVKCTAGNYANRYLMNIITKIEHNNLNYVIGIQWKAMETATDDATYFIRFEDAGNGKRYMQMATGMYVNMSKPTASTAPVALTPAYNSGFYFSDGSIYFTPMAVSGYAAIGESKSGSDIRYDIYRVDLDEVNRAPWKVTIVDGLDDSPFPMNNTNVTCTRSDISGLSKAYNGGYFFLPKDVTPEASDFNVDGATEGWNITVDSEAKTITVQATSPLTKEKIAVSQCYETTGRGNTDAVLRIDVRPTKNGVKLTSIKANITGAENLSNISIYSSYTTNFYAETPIKVAEVPAAENVTIDLQKSLDAGTNYLWLTATVKDDAQLAATIDAALTDIEYVYDQDVHVQLDVAAQGNPDGAMKIFALQRYVFVPNTDNCRFYRIPAMILDQNGNIVVAIDKRYNSNSDLGNHKIDVVARRSEDGGRTWLAPVTIAAGDGSTAVGYGYGDAALTLAPNGDIVCIMASGSTMFGYGLVNTGISISSDNGKSWSKVRSLYAKKFTDEVSNKTNSHGFSNIFASSGKGLTTKEGLILYTVTSRLPDDNTNYCYILSSNDNGQSWKIGKNLAYSGTDESKLEQMNDGSLLLSVRQSGNRGWNTGSADGTEWGTQYRTSDISGNACNADILYYSRASEGKPDIMLHSYINNSSRRNLTMAMSIDGGKSWANICNIVQGSSCYSTMVKLPDGSVALLFEDESYTDGNGYTINYVTLAEEQILAWYDELKQILQPTEAEVRIAVQGSTAGPDSYGSFATSGWATSWTSNSKSGKSGLVVSADFAAFNVATHYSQRVFTVRCSAAGASDVITMKAPEGYYIEGYSIGGYAYTSNDPYSLISGDGSKTIKVNAVSGTPSRLTVTGLNNETASFTIKSLAANSKYACISHFTVNIREKSEPYNSIEQTLLQPAAEHDIPVYNLAGQRVANMTKGIYIIGGKKVIIK
ncbi:MAG: exo-alpha-sialidase [Bacteroidaceae bacterium]|nr:exo-alpha-sialidase [Bacteroidaceae bacterium]